jgi:hypothetical protein
MRKPTQGGYWFKSTDDQYNRYGNIQNKRCKNRNFFAKDNHFVNDCCKLVIFVADSKLVGS